ncbi:MAG: hypothetical protein A2066_18735 [Bacteroidetes bacterium GWB2_41_8]|nr:MAG: hypothetical protein A2066_18735 [Bacteroidetes bacterium GWB2_41_8]
MEKYAVQSSKESRVKKILDQQPRVSWANEVCVIYSEDSIQTAYDTCNSLNMAHELKQLPRTATKKQMLEIITKFS